MKIRYLDYYEKFECTAHKCKATCCAGWKIVIDDDSMQEYLKNTTAFGNRLRASIDQEEEVFHQDDQKRCAFLNRDDLCDIYSKLGEEALCYTCQTYPRHIEEFEDMNEVSLAISCPEVAEILLKTKDKISFYELEDSDSEYEEIDIEELDPMFYELLDQVRQEMFAIIQDRSIPIDMRIQLIERYARDVDSQVELSIFSINDVIDEYKNYNKKPDELTCEFSMEHQISDGRKSFERLYELEALDDQWHPFLNRIKNAIGVIDEDELQKKWKNFQTTQDLDIMKEQLMVYFLYGYFCGSVYDGYVYSKAKLAIFSTIVIEWLWFGYEQVNHRSITIDEQIEITYRYAREIEHSDDNILYLEKII